MKGPDNKVIFSYEARFNVHNLFQIYFDFPLHGEESLKLSRRLRWSGTLLKKSFHIKKQSSKKELKEFYRNLAIFLKRILNKNINQKYLIIKPNKFIYSTSQFRVVGRLIGHRYKNLKITYKKKFTGHKYQLELIADKCHL